jgi:DNA-binding transcriptional ArsR family regulator
MSDEPEPAAGGAPPVSREEQLASLHQVTDPRTMRALAHPIRLELLEVLSVHGALTATQAGELIGESASSCSFHLRTLARHGFVEETGEGRGRERPWRAVAVGMRIPAVATDSETFVAAEALSTIVKERQLDRMRRWWARRRTADQEWVDAAANDEFFTWLTPAELQEINEAVFDVLSRHHDRLTDPSLRPPGAKTVELLYFAYPTSVGRAEADPDQTPTDGSGGVAGDEEPA